MFFLKLIVKIIFSFLANINLGHDVQMLKPGARIMVVGCRGSVTINPRHLMLPEASIHGVALGNSTQGELFKKKVENFSTKALAINVVLFAL